MGSPEGRAPPSVEPASPVMDGIDVAVPVSDEPPVIETPVVAFVDEAAPVVEPPVDPPVLEPPVLAGVFVFPVVDACVCVAVERLGRTPPAEESCAETIPAARAAIRKNFMVYVYMEYVNVDNYPADVGDSRKSPPFVILAVVVPALPRIESSQQVAPLFARFKTRDLTMSHS